jgi:hypothetical protein
MPRWSERVKFPDGGTAIVCFSGGRWCSRGCRRRATLRCDFPQPGNKSSSCDAWLCAGCAVHVGPDRDYCPHHGKVALPAE